MVAPKTNVTRFETTSPTITSKRQKFRQRPPLGEMVPACPTNEFVSNADPNSIRYSPGSGLLGGVVKVEPITSFFTRTKLKIKFL